MITGIIALSLLAVAILGIIVMFIGFLTDVDGLVKWGGGSALMGALLSLLTLVVGGIIYSMGQLP
jgi:hypothetical protein